MDRTDLREVVKRALGRSRVVALLGPRQSGKTDYPLGEKVSVWPLERWLEISEGKNE